MANDIISRHDAKALGLKRYFDGVPCKMGHTDEKLVSNLVCCECNRQKTRANYRPHPRKTPSREETLARQAAWYQANKDRLAEKRKAEPGKYRDSNIASAKAWSQANPEKAREYARQNRRKRRALMNGSGGTHTATDLAEILTAQGNRCAYCRCSLAKAEKHVDHIQPLARGGSNGRENLQYLCRPCNQAKSAKDPIEYAQSLGLLL